MENFREFQGSDLDECIRQALDWFDCPREALEVEIIQDAKSGIFGIVGARKAKIRARKAHVAEAMRSILGNGKKNAPGEAAPDTAREAPAPDSGNGVKVAGLEAHEGGKDKKQRAKPDADQREGCASGGPGKKRHEQHPQKSAESGKKHSHGRQRQEPPAPRERLKKPEGDSSARILDDEQDSASWPALPLSELDLDALERATLEVVGKLVYPLAGREVGMTFDASGGQARVHVDWEGDAGLLIGREGQTLMAVQYLASRIVSRMMQAALKVRLDIGDYRSRQNERLCAMAQSLAEKARATGRSWSTRPLSSFHRRVIHMCLQEQEDIQTRSAGEGPLKRVIISARRS